VYNTETTKLTKNFKKLQKETKEIILKRDNWNKEESANYERGDMESLI
jgi:hypothetical protein